MLGVSGLLGSSGDGAASAVVATSSGPPEGGGGLELGGGGSNSGGFSEDDKAAAASTRGEEGDRSSAGSRWPRQETLALLKIRSDMDVAFKDSSLKGPLWEEVSRKLAELGYQRSAKKCKEKFENVYKYHKRTKEGRASKPDAKTYRFFEQLEALDTHPIHNIPPPLGPPALPPPPPLHQQLHHHHHHQQKSQPPAASAAAAQPPPLMLPAATAPQPLQQITVPSATANKPAANNNSTAASQNTSASAPTTLSTINPSPLPPQAALQHPRNPTNIPQATSMLNPPSQPHSFRNLHASNSTSSSSSTSSDETLDGNDGGGRKRKRKWKDFFERLMRDVIKKQEELQKRFLEAIEKRERDRLVREEAWRMQEMTRMNREHEILVKERSIAAAKDAALIAFLQKMSSDPHNPVPVPPVPEDAAAVALQVVSPPLPQPPVQAQPQPQAQSQPQTPVAAAQQPQQQQATPTSPSNFGSIVRVNNNSIVAVGFGGGLEGTNVTSPASTSSSRWPKTEVQALIKLRTDLDMKYQESGPKGPLWEEISAGMRQLGYTRNAKRCKEKWENINKYFKKVKESNKKRPEDSKTCPYFHQLDALYREKTLMLRADVGGSSSSNPNYVPMLKPPAVVPVDFAQPTPTPTPTALPMMVRPEQQWPPLHPEDQRAPPEDIGSENMEEPNPDDDMDDDGDVGDDDDDEEDDEGGGYEIVTNKQKPAAGDS